jgi:hypothetical protein
MKTLMKFAIALSLFSFGVQAQQNTLTATTLAADSAAGARTFRLTSVTNVNAPSAGVPASLLYVIDQGQRVGQLVQVASVSGLNVTFVPRGSGANGNAHKSGAVVLVAAQPNWFYTSNPTGPCTTASTLVTPYVNTNTGEQWLCSSVIGTWVPGWNNSASPGSGGPTTAVASAAGSIVPSGPFFHITGTAAITGFTIASMIGFTGGQFCAVADAIWTWTAAGNIAVAGTTTAAGRQFCFRWDSNTSKWYPDKIA